MGPVIVVLRQTMGLLVAQHLNAVLDVTQLVVGRTQGVGSVLLNPLQISQALERLFGADHAQGGIATTGNQLLCLSKNSISRMPPRPSFTS